MERLGDAVPNSAMGIGLASLRASNDAPTPTPDNAGSEWLSSLDTIGKDATLCLASPSENDISTTVELAADATSEPFVPIMREHIAKMTHDRVCKTYAQAQKTNTQSWQIMALCAAELRSRTVSLSGGRGNKDGSEEGRTATIRRTAKECGVAVSTFQRDAQIGELLCKTPLNIQNSLEKKSFYEEALRSGQPEAMLINFAAQRAIKQTFSPRDAKRLASQEQNAALRAEREAEALSLPSISPLFQGDCREVLRRVIAPKSIKLLMTDPPYGIAATGAYRRASPAFEVIAGDESPEAACQLLSEMLASIEDLMADNCHLLVFTSWQHAAAFESVIQKAGYTLGTSLVWSKNEGAAGDTNDFGYTSERIIHATRGKTQVRPRIGNILAYSPQRDTGHPFQKPEALLRQLIEVTTVPGELVVDPFCGCGSAIIAAMSLERRAVGVEIDRDYYAMARLNLERYLTTPNSLDARLTLDGNITSATYPSEQNSDSRIGQPPLRFRIIILPAESAFIQSRFRLKGMHRCSGGLNMKGSACDSL